VVKTNDKDTHPVEAASTNPSAQAVVSPPRGVGDNLASQPSQAQPRGCSLFDTGFGQLIVIFGTMLLGVLIHLIVLVLIERRYSAQLDRVSRCAEAFGAGCTHGTQQIASGDRRPVRDEGEDLPVFFACK
jgi:hypothetical protein